MDWIIHKFGGTSLEDAKCFQHVVRLYEEIFLKGKNRIAIVLSAMAGVTDLLIELMNHAANRDETYLHTLEEIKNRHQNTVQSLLSNPDDIEEFNTLFQSDIKDLRDLLRAVWLSKTPSTLLMELVSGYGEIWSTMIMTIYMKSLNHHPIWIDARKVLISEDLPTGPSIDWELSKSNLNQILEPCEDVELLIITGFISSTRDGIATTLKRNGSDLSASVFGVLLEAKSIHIWTDVDGLYSADPRRVPDAVVLNHISYLEALELAYFGAKVLHPGSVAPAFLNQIPLYIHNTFQPDLLGTRIYNVDDLDENNALVKGFATIDSVALINLEGSGMIGVPGIAQTLFESLRKAEVSVVMISQASSEYSICIAVNESDGTKAKKAIEKAFTMEILEGHIQSVKLESHCGILSAVGDNMVNQPGIASIFFSALSRARINVRMISQGSSERNISAILDKKDLTRALRAVHSAFYLSHLTLSIGIIGTGLIGTSLLNQIRDQQAKLKSDLNIDLRVNAICNSKSMLLKNKLELSEWHSQFEQYKVELNLEVFVNHIHTDSVPHSVIIDCSASQEIADKYEEWLNSGIHVITPNKKANSNDWNKFQLLKKYIIKGPSTNPLDKTTHLFYETTVGAGLPVISTLKDLIKTGDEVIQIEGVLSGTMSYLFNELHESNSFSEIVMIAKEKGYTEPDPRDDLSGMDIARKLVILAREIGLQVNVSDVKIEKLIPEELFGNQSVEDFLVELKKYDMNIQKRYSDAKSNNMVLRYVGIVKSDGNCSIHLKSYPSNHPLANLKGSENMILFTTKRYNTYPLIVQGPGAGAEVTSGGVFAELLRLADLLGSS